MAGWTNKSVQILVASGHEIVVETGAGTLAGFPDASYANAGATIAQGPRRSFNVPLLRKLRLPL